MKKIIYILFISILIVSCTSKTIFKKPDDLIPKEQMVDLLVDIQLARGAKSVKNKDGKRNIDYMHLVYEKYQIDSTRFVESNFYYTTDVDQYADILKKVKKQIIEKRDFYDKIVRERDSLKRKKQPIKKKKVSKDVLKPSLGNPVKK